MKALVVEDDLAVQKIYRSWLEKAGFEVEAASSQRAADIILAIEPRPEVITVDVNLEDIQGELTFLWIESIRLRNPNALLLVVSGVLKPTDAERLAKLGADAAFEKMDVTHEKPWWKSILDTISGVAKQEPLKRDLAVLKDIAVRVTAAYNATGASLRLPQPPSETEKAE